MDNQLLCELYRIYAGELSLYLYSMCRDKELTKDLLQEIFLKAMLSLPADHTNFRAWLYRVARNLCYNEMRNRKREVAAIPSQEGADDGALFPGGSSAKDAQPPLHRILTKERNQRLYEGILRLSPAASQVVVMQYFGGLSQKEIASVLGISPGNVRVIACRAREQLRVHMEQYENEGGGTDEL